MKIAIVGDFDPNYPLHPATEVSIRHAARGREVQIDWLPTESLTHADHEKQLSQYAGFFIAPGSPYKDLHGALNAIRFAREQKHPLLATCGGFQHVVIEYARNVLGFADAQHAEYDPSASRLFVSKLACSLAGRVLPIELSSGSLAHRIYGQGRIEERYYCNFGLNPEYRSLLKHSGLAVTGIEVGDSSSRGEARIIELPAHPFFIATLFVPQAESREEKPHPMICAFLEAVTKVSQAMMDNETWILEAADEVIRKKIETGVNGLSPWEGLVYCLWVADYSMRNAGDMDTAGDLFRDFQTDGAKHSKILCLLKTYDAFALPKHEFEVKYFEIFDSICEEIRSAEPR